MTSKYNSPFSIGKRQTLFLDVNDPRIRGYKAGISAARAGSEIVVVNSEGGALLGSSFVATPRVLKTQAPKGFTGKVPGTITNLAAYWQNIEGYPALIFTFDIDLTLPDNDTVDSFEYTLSDGVAITPGLLYKKLNKASPSQEIIFYYSDNTKYFGEFQGTFTEFRVAAHDKTGIVGEEAVLTDIPVYNNDLPAPVITVTSIPMGYAVDWNTISQVYQYISIEEVVSDAGTAPSTGYQQVYLSNIKPATVLTPTTDPRWVKARFTDNAGTYGPYSTAVKVTPTNPISADIVPPNEVTAVSAAWSGDNIVVSYTLPATDPGARFQIALTAPNSSVGYFYVFPSGVSLNQTATITKADLFAQFGAYYSSFSGVIKSIDAADNKSSGVSFSVGARPNPLAGITPTFTSVALVNGYSISFDKPSGASYAEIYQKYSSWDSITPIDSFTGTYLSGGASGTNTVTLSGITSNTGATVSPISGYRVIGNGIPNNTYITSVSGNQITVNNNFTSQVSGTITGYALVYSGSSPANISSTIYEDTYIIIRYYDDFGNASNYSAEQAVVPLSPTSVDVTGPGNVSPVGMSTSAGIDSSGTLGFNGYINLSWDAVTESSLRGYKIRFTTTESNDVYSYVDYPIDQTNIPTGSLTYRLQGLAVGATYKISIATYDQYNNTSTDYISFADTTITGTPAITDYITAGNFQFGVGVDPSDITGITGTKRGLFFDDSNYWFLNASDSARLKVGGSTSNYLLWDGADFTIDGNITARGGSFSGNIELSTLGASIYNGDVTTSPGNLTGDGFIFNKDGLLIRKGTNQVSLDTTNGAITANAGNIADWIIHTSKIEKLDPTSGKYAGMSSTGLYKFWSGSTTAGGDTTQFAVDRTGRVFASNVQISGGGIDIGALPSNLSSGFHVTSAGLMYATGATINGSIEATSGSIKGNFQVVSGSFYTGTSPTSTSVVINDKGLASIGSTNNTLTAILNTPISFGNLPTGNGTTSTGATSGNPLPTAITFFTNAALIGGWVINDTSIRDRSQQFILDSSANKLSIFGSVSNVNYGLNLSTGANFLEAGTRDGSNNITSPSVYITKAGILNANGANLTGKITVSGGTMAFGDNVNGTDDGLFVNANNYWYDNGLFKVGNSISATLTSVTIGGATTIKGGEITMEVTGSLDSDNNNFAGDPTITINGSNKLTKGRRFIYNGINNIPTNVVLSGNTGSFTPAPPGSPPITVKVGDIVMVA